MDFSIKKPAHIFALIMLILVFFLMFVLPMLSYFNILSSDKTVQMDQIPESVRQTIEIIAFILQIALFMVLPIIVVLLWYSLVNKLTIKEGISHLKLKLEGIDVVFLWGIISGIVMLVIGIAISYILVMAKQNPEGNVQQILKYFSIPSAFILVTIQPISEEIFFRGFLLEKIGSFFGEIIAIFVTAILFGLAHMGYGGYYPVVFPMLLGLVLGAVVVKTKNLYSSITAHILFNFTVFMLAIFSTSLT